MTRHHLLWIAALALASLSSASQAQTPWGQGRPDQMAQYRSGGYDPFNNVGVYGQRPGSPYQPALRQPTQADRLLMQDRVKFQPTFRRNEEDERRRQQLQLAASVAQNVKLPEFKTNATTWRNTKAATNATTELAHTPRPSGSWGRGWLTGIVGGIASLFGAIFRWRKKEG